MSPEQAQGKKELDARSDIFSFGSVLYEMVTQRRAFPEDTMAELLAAILRDEPKKISELVPSVPLDLEKLITRALRKEPERRFQSMADMRVALVEIKEELDSGSFVSAEQVIKMAPKPRRKTWHWIASALLAIVIGAAGWLYFSQSEPVYPPTRTIPLTTYAGDELDPALSPDGNQVAFCMRGDDGHLHLYVKMIGGGEPLQITKASAHDMYPAWSADGRWTAFYRVREGVNEVYRVSALGGAEQQLAISQGDRRGLSWSPNQELLAMVDKESPEDRDSIFLLSLETGEKRRLTTPPSHYLRGDRHPRFSPDGETLAFVREIATSQSDIYLVPVEGGDPRRLTVGNQYTSALDWTSDGSSIVFSSNRAPRTGFGLWRIAASGGEPEPLEVGEGGRWPTISRQGGRLAYVKEDPRQDIWRVGGPTASEEERMPAPFISSTRMDYEPRYSPDGQSITFTSTRSGYSEIWICDSDGSNRQLTFLEDPLTDGGIWSPDGKQIAFSSPKEGSRDVYVVSAAGGIPRRLTTESWNERPQAWSNDGGWIYLNSNRSGGQEMWKMPEEGGEQIQITKNRGTVAFESPDGRFLYFGKRDPNGGPRGIWRVPVDGGEEVQVLKHAGFGDWAVTERGIFYINRETAPGPTIEFFEFATERVSLVTVVEVASSFGFSVSPDQRWILYVMEESANDIMLVENFR
jgi:Tol biopolymer transport system component